MNEVEMTSGDPQRTLYVMVSTTLDALGSAVSQAWAQLINTLQQSGVSETGYLYTRFASVEEDQIRIEAGVVTDASHPGHPQIGSGVLPGGDALCVTVNNGLEGVLLAGKTLMDAAASMGRTPRGHNYELYIDGDTGPLGRGRVEVYMPLT